MGLKINGSTSGSIEIDVPAVAGTDTSITIPAKNGGTFIVEESTGNIDLGPLDINGSASDDSVNIDGSGRLLVGATTARSTLAGSSVTPAFQIEGTGYDGSSLSLVRNVNSGGNGEIILGKTRSTSNGGVALVSSGDTLGGIRFDGADGSDFATGALIAAQVDGTPGSNDMPGRLVFSTTADGASSPTEAMRITSGQRLRVGMANFASDVGSSNRGFEVQANGIILTGQPSTATQSHHLFYNPNGTVGSIQTNGSSTSFNTSSDYRLKENVVPVADGITRLQQLNPARFNFIADPDKTVDGFLAHEVQDVVPEAISGEKDAVDDDGNPVYQGIDQSKLVPLLTAALQEAISKIETLETANASQAATIAAFEARLTALEGGAS